MSDTPGSLVVPAGEDTHTPRPTPGRLAGVGVGPGDPELITRKGARLIAEADVVAYHAGPSGNSIARSIAADLIPDGAIEELLQYPVTTGTTSHRLGYYGALADFYADCADRLAAHLELGRTVVVLAEGDPMFYGSYMYVHDMLSPHYATEVVPGVTAMSAATAQVATGLSRHEDVVTVLPGTLPVPELARRLADTDAAVIMKLGRTFSGVVEALTQAGRLSEAVYVERATTADQVVHPVSDVDPAHVPYMSIIIVPGPDTRADNAGRAQAAHPGQQDHPRDGADPIQDLTPDTPPTRATVYVVGLGPGPERWLTPEAAEVLGQVDHVVGYGPYVARVRQRPGLTRHPSGNTVEVDRARFALDLARQGESVAVVSGGDAGVFGMAAAVFEAADTPRFADVPIQVVPGVSAFQAVSALAGAPMGADFAAVSLSDRLKPWSVIEQRLRHIARADLVLAIYNPRSTARPDQLHTAHHLLLAERSPDTVVVIGRDVGRAEESLTVTTLGEFDPDTVDMKCLVLVGASGTRRTDHGRVWTPRFVPDPDEPAPRPRP